MAPKQKRGIAALDPLMAGFAGGAAAFLIYAMPGAQFNKVVSLSGLPMILAAAQPPLGLTARLAGMAAAGVGCFILVFLVLRALGKPAPKPKRRSGPVEIELAAPKLRRADAHPDAPARRPILAGIDLGKSFDDIGREEELEAGIQLEDEFAAEEPQAEAWDGGPFEAAPPIEEPQAEAWDGEPFEPAPWLEEPSDEADEDHDVVEQAADEGFHPAADEDDAPDLEADAIPAVGAQEAESASEDDQGLPDEPDPEPVAASARCERVRAPGEGESIPALMERLEAGLQRRQPSGPRIDIVETRRPSAPAPLDQRLRGAIDELQKLAGRSN